MPDLCYICQQNATSVEHAPARSFFPEGMRENLITVPSCAVHNEDTSKDDEYVRNIIAMSLGNNQVALNHFLNKCIRSLAKSPGLFRATTGQNKRVAYQEKGDAEIKPTYAFSLDRERIDFVLRKISYAIFYKKFQMPWNRELFIGTEYLRTEGMQADDLGLLIQGAKKLLVNPTFEGTNQQVFQYVFLPTDTEDNNDQLLIMKFYEGFEVWVFPHAETIGPKL